MDEKNEKKPKIVSLIPIFPPLPIRTEADAIESFARYHRRAGYRILKQAKLQFGTVDLAMISPQNELFLVEFKMSAGANEIAHALGQILLYREQVNTTKFVKVHSIIRIVNLLPKKIYKFLYNVCSKYGVELMASTEEEAT